MNASIRIRHLKQSEHLESLGQAFLKSDCIKTLEDLHSKIDRKCLPEGIQEMTVDGNFVLAGVSIDPLKGPTIKFSLIINTNLMFSMFVNEMELEKKEVFHILPRGEITNASQISNILAFLKVRSETNSSLDAIKYCCNLLRSHSHDHDDEKEKKIIFLAEQLELLFSTKFQRRYSSSLIAAAVIWDNISPTLYRHLIKEELLTLPSQKYIRRITGCCLDTGFPNSTIEYLKTRVINLFPRERLVSIILDEVYSGKRVEYQNGRFYGYENSGVTKTLLCFMIKSIAGQYEDVVAMIPLSRINSAVIKHWFFLVLQTITKIGFNTVAVITDAHASNRKFFTQELCHGNMKTSIRNPFSQKDNKIFLTFDSVHVFKNIYNNLLNKKIFNCPPFQGAQISANLQHVKNLYISELSSSIRFGYKLSDKVLAPHPIERTKVDLANSFFDDSTAKGLEELCLEEKWKETANFIYLVKRFWTCVNVQSIFASSRKKDDRRKAITSEDQSQIQFLQEFLKWLIEWERMSSKGGLSNEIFFAAKQCSLALSELALYLLEMNDIEYVLLGKISSNPLERRFGRYRQMSGANYFVSVRQFLEAEKKIRIRSLVQFDAKSIPDVRNIFTEKEKDINEKLMNGAEELLGALQSDNFSSIQHARGHEGVIFYIAGYISKGMLRKTACTACHHLLAQTTDTPEPAFAENQYDHQHLKEAFLNSLNRGGLAGLLNLSPCFAIKGRYIRRWGYSEAIPEYDFSKSNIQNSYENKDSKFSLLSKFL